MFKADFGRLTDFIALNPCFSLAWRQRAQLQNKISPQLGVVSSGPSLLNLSESISSEGTFDGRFEEQPLTSVVGLALELQWTRVYLLYLFTFQ